MQQLGFLKTVGGEGGGSWGCQPHGGGRCSGWGSSKQRCRSTDCKRRAPSRSVQSLQQSQQLPLYWQLQRSFKQALKSIPAPVSPRLLFPISSLLSPLFSRCCAYFFFAIPCSCVQLSCGVLQRTLVSGTAISSVLVGRLTPPCVMAHPTRRTSGQALCAKTLQRSLEWWGRCECQCSNSSCFIAPPPSPPPLPQRGGVSEASRVKA